MDFGGMNNMPARLSAASCGTDAIESYKRQEIRLIDC